MKNGERLPRFNRSTKTSKHITLAHAAVKIYVAFLFKSLVVPKNKSIIAFLNAHKAKCTKIHSLQMMGVPRIS